MPVPKTNHVPIVAVPLVDGQGKVAPFELTFYGIPLSEFLRDDGGGRIRRALEKRGIEGYVSSPFLIYERRLRI